MSLLPIGRQAAIALLPNREVHIMEQRYGAEAKQDHEGNRDDNEYNPPPYDGYDRQHHDECQDRIRILSWTLNRQHKVSSFLGLSPSAVLDRVSRQSGMWRLSRCSSSLASRVAASRFSSLRSISSCRSMCASLGPMFAAISWRRYLADRNIPASTPISTPSKVSIVITACLRLRSCLSGDPISSASI